MNKRSTKRSSKQRRLKKGGAISKTNENKQRNSKFSWLSSLIIVAVILLCISMLLYKFIFSSPNVLEQLPNPSLKGVESRVAVKIESLRNNVETNPSSARAWGKLGMNLQVHGLGRASIKCYKQASILGPDEIRWPYYNGIIMYELGLPENLQWFELSQRIKPGYAPIHIRYGKALYDSGLLKESSEAFNRALKVDPKSSHAYLGLARISLVNGDLSSSRDYLLKALEFDKSHKEVHWLLAEVYRRFREPQKADRELKYAERLPEITPLYDPIYTDLLKEGVSSYWGQLRGRAYMKKGNYESAVREFQLVLQEKPDAEAYYDLGLAFQLLGKFKKAVENYMKSERLDSTSIENLSNLAISLFEIGQIKEAIDYIEKTIRLNPNDPHYYLNFGMIFIRSDHTAKAIDMFRQGLIYAPNDTRILIRLAWVLSTSSEVKLRNGIEALQLAKTMCEITNYKMPEALDVLAAAFAETGQFDRAIELVRQAHKLASKSNRLELARKIQSRLSIYELKQPFRDKIN